jgi:drug/metabolite transporter (DMT)-like permease
VLDGIQPMTDKNKYKGVKDIKAYQTAWISTHFLTCVLKPNLFFLNRKKYKTSVFSETHGYFKFSHRKSAEYSFRMTVVFNSLWAVGKKRRYYLLAGVLFTLLGAILFSGKAVLVKIIYRDFPIDVVSLLALRMLFSLPFYIAMYCISLKSFRELNVKQRITQPERKKLVVHIILVGLLGYYISSWLDFAGLQFISAGLERIILFSYPTFTILFGALLYKTRITGYQIAALLLSYAGVAIAFVGDIEQDHSTSILQGSLLVFFCAITYALYVLQSGRIIPRTGASYFTAVGMIGATAGVLCHFFISGNNLAALENLPAKMYVYILVMAVFTTVLPSLLMSIGLKRIGSNNAAIISSVGPLSTILQAYLFLGEKFGLMQALGTLLVFIGVFIIGKKAGK